MGNRTTKILMVCLGNICRSPVAEGIMRAKLHKYELDYIVVDSAGTAGYHIGEAPDARTIANAKKNGLDISMLRARKFLQQDLDEFDIIYTMDDSNRQNVIALCANDKQKHKIKMILNEVNPSKNMPVPDPYYGREKDFQLVFDLLDNACEVIALSLIKQEELLLNKV